MGVKLFFFYCEPSGPASFGLNVHSQHSFLLLMKSWRAPDYWEIKRVESLLSSVRSKKMYRVIFLYATRVSSVSEQIHSDSD